MTELIYRWLPRIFGCHCRSDRSFSYKGRPFPICARCTGELFGIVLGFVLFWFWKLPIGISCMIMIPLVLDGFLQALTKYESTNVRRLLTGLLFGIGVMSLFIQSTIFALRFGIEYGQALRIK